MRLAVVFLIGCGGKADTMPDSATPPDGSTPPPARMFGIDVSPAPGESYADVIALARGAGATFIPQAIDWTMLEAGPDDTFAHAAIDTHKWDVTGGFAGDATAGVVRWSGAVPDAHLRARYALDGTLSASVDATIDSLADTEATLLVRFGALDAGNRCSDPGDEFVAIVITGGAVAAASCRDGVFASDAVVQASRQETLRVRRTPSQLVVETASTPVATLSLAALPASFAGAGRVYLYAGNPSAAATASFAQLHVTGDATWDVATDRFVGDPDFDVPAALEVIDGGAHVPLVVTLRTINTVTTMLPSDLNVPDANGFVDLSRARARYRDVVDYLLSRIPDVQIAGFSVGNEIDAYLGDNAVAWAQVATFAADAIPYVRGKLPAGTPVGITVTTGFANHPEAAAAEAPADTLLVTYYPLAADYTARDPSVVADDVAAVVAATDKPILFIEAGYPSAPASSTCPQCTGSEANQAAFFTNLFAAWDAHPDRVRGFSVSWLTDASAATVQGWETYYGSSDPAFIAYLATLGVRTQTGTPKQAWSAITTAAHLRGL
jgi:hypothetical protein